MMRVVLVCVLLLCGTSVFAQSTPTALPPLPAGITACKGDFALCAASNCTPVLNPEFVSAAHPAGGERLGHIAAVEDESDRASLHGGSDSRATCGELFLVRVFTSEVDQWRQVSRLSLPAG